MREVRPHRRTHEGSLVTGHIDLDRIAAHGRLMSALAEACDAGERIPCIGKPGRWQSEDPAEQEAAAHGC